MTISSNLMGLYDGSLLSRVQDALGNSGATAELTDGSIKLTGIPTGEGLKSRAAALSAKTTTVSTNKDTVSLSPTARTALTNQEIGLKLILAGRVVPNLTSAKGNASPTTSSSSRTPSNVSDVQALAQEKPTQAIADLVAAGRDAFNSISTTQGFTAAASADPTFLKTFADSLPDNLGAGFVTALKNGTLTVQTGAQAGYIGGGVTLTGTSESATSSSGTGNFDLSTTNVVTAGFSGFGTLAFSWPKAS